jgi:threonine/homoserine/homoserine lactone efflux protein
MTLDQMLAFLLFAVAAAVTPGPSNVVLTATGAAVGVVRGVPSVLGAAAGMGLLMALVAAGLGSVMLRSPLLIASVKVAGIAFLLWLAWKIATARRDGASEGTAPVGFWRALTLQWVNPKAWVVTASAAGAFLRAEGAGAVGQAAVLGLLFVLAALPSGLIWLACGAAVQRWLRTERAWRAFNLAMAGLLAASIVLFVW